MSVVDRHDFQVSELTPVEAIGFAKGGEWDRWADSWPTPFISMLQFSMRAPTQPPITAAVCWLAHPYDAGGVRYATVWDCANWRKLTGGWMGGGSSMASEFDTDARPLFVDTSESAAVMWAMAWARRMAA